MLAKRYLGILVNVPDEAGIKITNIENIQREDEIFLIPAINIAKNNKVNKRSKWSLTGRPPSIKIAQI